MVVTNSSSHVHLLDHSKSTADLPLGKSMSAAASEALVTSSADSEFLCGVALSVYQNSGDGSSSESGPLTNWGAFENHKSWLPNHIEGGARCGKSNNFWELYEEDIQRAAQLNIKFFRLSLEWSRIQPTRGEVDLAAVEHYHKIFDALARAGMQTTVTLYHFVHPLWFDELGHFEVETNVQLFAEYAALAFKHFGSRCALWATFNEINVQSFCSYIYGTFPPAKLARFTTAGRFTLNCLKAHIAGYDAIKALPGGDKALVGIVHNYMTYMPRYPLAVSANWVTPVVGVINKCWSNDIMIKFFLSGKFSWPSFIKSGWQWQYPGGRPPCDWIGLNYYGRGIISPFLTPTYRPGDLPTDMPFAAYAPGLYEAIADMAKIGLPIYITETGICDGTSLKRPAFFASHFDELVRAVEDGYDVRGLTMWTLVRNFEWAYGWTKDFGLYGWSPDDPTNSRILHESSKVLAAHYMTLPARIRKARNERIHRKPVAA